MQIRLLLGITCSLLFSVYTPLSAQFTAASPAQDRIAARYVQQGTYFLEIGNLPVAQEAFRRAYKRPFHIQTNLATYLLGLSFYQNQQTDSAAYYFKDLIQQHPDSRYIAEAKYHLGLIWMGYSQPDWQARGVKGLLSLHPTADTSFAQDIQQHVLRFLFRCEDIALLETLFEELPPTYQMWVIEPLCYRYVQGDQLRKARKRYERFQDEVAFFSPFIEKMLNEPLIYKSFDPDVVRIALVLPLSLRSPFRGLDTLSLHKSQRLPLEYAEGFLAGLETASQTAKRHFHVQVFDSRRDTNVVNKIIQDLAYFQPDLLVGDVYNTQSRQLSDWAERQQTPQIVPLSSTANLTFDRSQTFLVHPPAEIHGIEMAKYARQVMGLNRVAVWDDGQASTSLLAKSFQLQFEALGGEVLYMVIDSSFKSKTRKEIVRLTKVLVSRPLDGMYIPLQHNEEAAGLILSEVRVLKPKLIMMGGPHFANRYQTIDSDLKTALSLHYTTNYFTDSRSPEYRHFERDYLQEYGFPPSRYVIQGYDLGVYVGRLLDQYQYADGYTLSQALHRAGRQDALHLDLDFQHSEVNQAVNIVKHTPAGRQCVNCNEPLTLGPLVQGEGNFRR